MRSQNRTTVLVILGGLVAGLLIYNGVTTAFPSRPEASAPQAESTTVGAQVPDEPTAVPPPPNDAIYDYYVLLRQDMYDVAWKRTTDNFKATYYPQGFESYRDSWAKTEKLEVEDTEIVSKLGSNARVTAELRYITSGSLVVYNFTLVYDSQQGFWLIDTVEH